MYLHIAIATKMSACSREKDATDAGGASIIRTVQAKKRGFLLDTGFGKQFPACTHYLFVNIHPSTFAAPSQRRFACSLYGVLESKELQLQRSNQSLPKQMASQTMASSLSLSKQRRLHRHLSPTVTIHVLLWC
jgi:hypothetical protein